MRQTVQPVYPADFASTEYSPWGDDNLFPQNVLKDLEMNSIALRALEKENGSLRPWDHCIS